MPELYHLLNMISKGEIAAAQRELAAILRADPQNLEAWLLMAHAVEDRRRKADCYRQALRLNPAHDFARKQLEALERPAEEQAAAAPAAVKPPPAAPQRAATKLCPYCQQENPLNALTCWACGGRLLHSSLSQPGGLGRTPLAASGALGWCPTDAALPSAAAEPAEAPVAEPAEAGELAWLPALAEQPEAAPAKTSLPAASKPVGLPASAAPPAAPLRPGEPRPAAQNRPKKAPAGQAESFLDSIYMIEVMVYALLATLFWALMVFAAPTAPDPLNALGASFGLFFGIYLLYLVGLAIWSGMAGLFKIIAVIGFGGMPLYVLIPGDLVRRLAFAFYGGRKAIRVAFGGPLKKTPR